MSPILYIISSGGTRTEIFVVNRSRRPITARAGTEAGPDDLPTTVPPGGRRKVAYVGGPLRFWVAFHDLSTHRSLGMVRLASGDDRGNDFEITYPPAPGRLVDVPYTKWDADW